MGKNRDRTVWLASSERARMVDECNRILAATSVLTEHLEVAAARADVALTGWTDTQLDALIRAARGLRGAVEAAPLRGD